MKKRIISALLAAVLTLSLAVNAFAVPFGIAATAVKNSAG